MIFVAFVHMIVAQLPQCGFDSPPSGCLCGTASSGTVCVIGPAAGATTPLTFFNGTSSNATFIVGTGGESTSVLTLRSQVEKPTRADDTTQPTFQGCFVDSIGYASSGLTDCIIKGFCAAGGSTSECCFADACTTGCALFSSCDATRYDVM
jgi:hypothetical protein